MAAEQADPTPSQPTRSPSALTDAGSNPASPQNRKRDRRVKLGFMAVFIIVAVVLAVRQWIGPTPQGFTSDLPAALSQAAAEGRRVVVLIDDRPPSEDGKRIVTFTMVKPANSAAMRKLNVLGVRTTPDNQALKPYGPIKKTPTTLLLRPDGKEINRREGYIGETDFRAGFLNAPPLSFSRELDRAFRQEGAEKQKVLLLVEPTPLGEVAETLLTDTLWKPAIVAALDKANVLFIKTSESDPRLQPFPMRSTPAMLLLTPEGKEIARREGAITEADVISLLEGKPKS